jgi:polyribonucleotide 5'-hydroxyl-kinase
MLVATLQLKLLHLLSSCCSLSTILCAYAVRLGRTPTFVDLDIGQGQITVPGAMAAVALDSSTLSVEEGFSLAAPLAFFYGHTSQSENPELFRALVTRLAECVQQRLSNDKDAAAAGLIVNTCGWVEGLGLELLRHCIRALAIDIVLVVGVSFQAQRVVCAYASVAAAYCRYCKLAALVSIVACPYSN